MVIHNWQKPIVQKLFEKVRKEGAFQLDGSTYLSSGENLMSEYWYNDEDYDFEKNAIYLCQIVEGRPEEVTEEDLAKYIVDQYVSDHPHKTLFKGILCRIDDPK